MEDVRSGVIQSKPRNRLLAQVFKELGIIEKYGAGVKRVIEDFNAYGLVEPHFEEKSGGFHVLVSDKTFSRYTTQEITLKILQLIRTAPGITRKALAAVIGISESGVKYHLDKLKKQGRIEHIGPTKKGYWKIIE